MTKASDGRINQVERRELRKLLDQTFAVLKQQINVRESQIREVIRKRILKVSANDIKVVENALRKAFEQAEARGITIKTEGHYQKSIDGLKSVELVPAGLYDRIDDEVAALKGEAEMGHLSLSEEKLRLEREITLSALTSADARAMVEAIPTVDKLMPAIEVAEKTQLTTSGR